MVGFMQQAGPCGQCGNWGQCFSPGNCGQGCCQGFQKANWGQCGFGGCQNFPGCSCCQCNGPCQGPVVGFTSEDWSKYNETQEGLNLYRWWAEWIPTHPGQAWVNNKRWESRCIVNGMIQ